MTRGPPDGILSRKPDRTMSSLASLSRISRPIDRAALIERYRRNRERSRALFDLLIDENALYSRPIALRHPFVFYEGHVPAFSLNTLVKSALGEPGIDSELETLFARGIDPPTDGATADDAARERERWPGRDVVERFARAADARVIEALTRADIDRPGHPWYGCSSAVHQVSSKQSWGQGSLRSHANNRSSRFDRAAWRQLWRSGPATTRPFGR